MNAISHATLSTRAEDASTVSPNTSSTSAGGASVNDDLTNENTFLKLLVAQIQNQDPTNPTDPVQFVGQLTQYSELEQLIQINSGIKAINGGSSPDVSGNPITAPATTE